MCSPAGCKGLRKYKKLIERDEGIAEELQDGNKSNRGADDQQVKELADNVSEVPRTQNALVPLLSVVPLQLLAYYVAVDKGLEIGRAHV